MKFVQKKTKQQGWAMAKTKGASLERIVLNFESENHFHPNSTVPVAIKSSSTD